MLKGAAGFTVQTKENTQLDKPFVTTRSADGKRWRGADDGRGSCFRTRRRRWFPGVQADQQAGAGTYETSAG